MSITLQSTVGGFSAEFMRRLPALEQAMVAHGLEPSAFVIPNDIQFLEYFYQRCIAEDEPAPEQERRMRRPGLINRIFRWMAQPI